MAEHTPGPWTILLDGTCSGTWPHILADGDEDNCIAGLETSHIENRRSKAFPASYAENPRRFKPTPKHDEIMANARLIAAAPDLLSIAQQWAALDGGAWHAERHANEKARLIADTLAAIAKATQP